MLKLFWNLSIEIFRYFCTWLLLGGNVGKLFLFTPKLSFLYIVCVSGFTYISEVLSLKWFTNTVGMGWYALLWFSCFNRLLKLGYIHSLKGCSFVSLLFFGVFLSSYEPFDSFHHSIVNYVTHECRSVGKRKQPLFLIQILCIRKHSLQCFLNWKLNIKY